MFDFLHNHQSFNQSLKNTCDNDLDFSELKPSAPGI